MRARPVGFSKYGGVNRRSVVSQFMGRVQTPGDAIGELSLMASIAHQHQPRGQSFKHSKSTFGPIDGRRIDGLVHFCRERIDSGGFQQSNGFFAIGIAQKNHVRVETVEQFRADEFRLGDEVAVDGCLGMAQIETDRFPRPSFLEHRLPRARSDDPKSRPDPTGHGLFAGFFPAGKFSIAEVFGHRESAVENVPEVRGNRSTPFLRTEVDLELVQFVDVQDDAGESHYAIKNLIHGWTATLRALDEPISAGNFQVI